MKKSFSINVGVYPNFNAALDSVHIKNSRKKRVALKEPIIRHNAVYVDIFCNFILLVNFSSTFLRKASNFIFLN